MTGIRLYDILDSTLNVYYSDFRMCSSCICLRYICWILGTFYTRYNKTSGILKVLCNTIILILYLISPIDILPEAILGPIGLIDDVAAIGIYILQLLATFVNYLATQQGQR